jgi:integrase/recombinase XerD
MKPNDFAIRLTAFLGQYLPAQRNVSPHTIKAYRDAFKLLLYYCRDRHGRSAERVSLDLLDASLVLAFLQYLQYQRHCSPRTCNHRLSALHAFFRYLQTAEPERMVQCQRILAIPLQRCVQPALSYLSKEDLSAILAEPDLSTTRGRRDATLLSLLYDTAARVQELVDLSVGDVRLDTPAQVRLTGKGRKARVVPLLSATVALLSDYLEEHQLNRPERLPYPLFWNRRRERLTRSGIRYVLAKYAHRARTKNGNLPMKVTPHLLRHSKAMHLLHAGNPTTVIQAILGHADLRTTDIYARANLEMKRRALEKAAPGAPSVCCPTWQNNPDLLDWLRAL